MIQLEERRERQAEERPPYLDQMKCSRCGGGLARVFLTVGSVVEQRCHHSIVVNGKRQTCGWVTRVTPTRTP